MDMTVEQCKKHLYHVLPPEALDFIRESDGLYAEEGTNTLISQFGLDKKWVENNYENVLSATVMLHMELQHGR